MITRFITRFDTLVGRTVLASLIGITLMHVLSLWSYEHALERELSIAQQTQLADRLVTIRRSLAVVPGPGRDEAAHRLSSGPLDVHWSATEHAIKAAPLADPWAGIDTQIRQTDPSLGSDDVIISPSDRADPHVALISLKLPDESWVNVSLLAYARTHPGSHSTLLSTTVMALGVVALSVLIAGWVTKPMRKMADAVRELHPSDVTAKLDESGPREVRELATAFNDMRGKISRLVEQRTQALAAVSHDLRTPLTRLKLRLEDLGDHEVAGAMARDLTEVEQMIDATLSYLKGKSFTEQPRALDLAALLRTLTDEATDMGQEIHLEGPRALVIHGRHLGLRRAFSNLIQNAAKYGERARITVETAPGAARVLIDDEGPGIPSEKLESVFEPFVRLETSRNRETGGVGLGLTIAKAEIEENGGTLSLTNRQAGGLRAAVVLPSATGVGS